MASVRIPSMTGRMPWGVLALALLGGCSSMHAAAARRAARHPEPSQVRTSSDGCVEDLAAMGTTVFWSERDRILRWDTASASVPVVVAQTRDARGIALDASSVYWIEPPEATEGRRTLRRSGWDGADVRTVAAVGDRTEDLTIADGALWWIDASTHRQPSELWRVALEGGEPRRIAELDDWTSSLAIVDGHAYWYARGDTPQIRRRALEGGAPETIVDAEFFAFAVDARGLAWVTRDAVHGANADGSDAHVLARVQAPRAALALTGDRVHVVDGNALVSIPRASGTLERTELAPARSHRIATGSDHVFVAGSSFYPHEGCLGTTVQRVAR